MFDVGPLALLWLLLRTLTGTRSDPYRTLEPRATRAPAPAAPRAAQAIPASYHAPARSARSARGEWESYHPITPAIVARAREVLRDRSVSALVEPDPERPGQLVRYVRQRGADGKTVVSAWQPRAGAAPRPGVPLTL